MYRRAIEANPRHTYALYNYAVLLEDVKQDYDRAEAHFQRAVEASPRDALALGDYAAFLRTRRSKPQVRGPAPRVAVEPSRLQPPGQDAAALYARATKEDPENATLLYNYATLLCDELGQADQAVPVRRATAQASPRPRPSRRRHGPMPPPTAISARSIAGAVTC